MSELLHAAALLPAAVGACCTAGRRRAGAEAAVALLMLVAMADLVLRLGVLPTIAWSALLLLAGLAVALGERMRAGRARRGAASARHAVPGMAALAAVGALLMGAQMLAMGVGLDGGAHRHGAGQLLAATTGGGLLYAAIALGLLRTVRGAGAVVARLEITAMAASVALMALAVLL